MTKATEKRLFLTRHAQAEHNVTEDWSIADAPLTALGREQSKQLHEDTKDTIQKTAELLVSSPFRRPLSTMILGYPELRKRLEAKGKPVIILPQLQECSENPCDIGSPREVLETNPEYSGLDFSQLTPDWNSKQGFYAADVHSLQARARWCRQWLRERPEKEIVVVAHGEVLRYITEGYDSGRHWGNAEVREYTFTAENDAEATIVPVQKIVQEGADLPTVPSQKSTH